MALGIQLLVLEIVLGIGVVVLYGTELEGFGLLVTAAVVATVALAAAGSLYGALAAGSRVRETILPLLFLPVAAPVLIAATQAWEAALEGTPGEGWPWCGLLAAVAVVQAVAGALAFGPLLEDT
jgi:heme exporter protein B